MLALTLSDDLDPVHFYKFQTSKQPLLEVKKEVGEKEKKIAMQFDTAWETLTGL